jgi:hypothetical protein
MGCLEDQSIWPMARRSVLMIGVLCSACDPSISSPSTPNVLPWVSGEAASSLDSQGHYIIPAAVILASQPVIDETRARDLTSAYLGMIASDESLLSLLVKQRHGGAVNPVRLKAAPRVELSLSPYQTTPPEYGDATLRGRGPYFMVRMQDGDEPVLTVAVSAHATDVQIVDGRLVFPSVFGNEFAVAGNPIGSGFANPISPEAATMVAGDATGAKITKVPELRRPDWLFSVFYSRWMITLDRPIRFRHLGSGQIEETSQVFVGISDSSSVGPITLLLPRAIQPAVEQVSSQESLTIRPGFPVWFDQVQVIR